MAIKFGIEHCTIFAKIPLKSTHFLSKYTKTNIMIIYVMPFLFNNMNERRDYLDSLSLNTAVKLLIEKKEGSG